MFNVLHRASEDCKKMMTFLSKLPVISQAEIQTAITQDGVRIARILQHIFQIESYKRDITVVPEVEAFSVLNLTHRILDHKLPTNDVIPDMDLFKRRARRLLNILADFVKILPEAIAIHGVALLNGHPVKAGGFANIYHGTYTNTDMEQVEVALKVLKIFHDQSDDDRRKTLQKFAKETLVWHSLRHQNIVPLLGVDGTTFPGVTMAMVSPWMRQGSVLNYMTEHSPSYQYAIPLLNDVIQGLKYLHSENIVHGDLCARNILIHERQACLTDFGLATFIESDTSRKSSTGSGSTRWMAPELLQKVPFKRTPASDVWAFGCVCCEIWTEGQVPFQHMSDGAIILAFSTIDADGSVPYETTPFDKAGTPMPARLWELVQLCFRRKATMRPTVVAIADLLCEMKGRVSPAQ
ncbi:kinase-like domain-containing protein [Mycena sanguinolenta]|nr:kinase-like domain-containing protein [Mycena sanguinolenta]